MKMKIFPESFKFYAIFNIERQCQIWQYLCCLYGPVLFSAVTNHLCLGLGRKNLNFVVPPLHPESAHWVSYKHLMEL